MGIKIKHGKPSTIIKAAKRAGEARAGAAIAQQAMANAARLQEKQMEMEYRTALKQQDIAIDLQMNERAKLWEIEKMELASRMDFQREEQSRQRKLDGYDNIDSQLDKEVQAGRMTEKEAEPYKLKNDLARQGMNVSISDITRQREGDEARYGVDPYWMRGKDAPTGSPERQLYEAEMKQKIEGTTGTVPYHLSTEFLRSLPSATAQEMLEAKGIFFDSDEEFEDWLVNREAGAAESTALPLSGKQLDVGVRTEPTGAGGGIEGEVGGGRIRVVSPEGQTGTILESELQEYLDQGFETVGESKAFRGAGATGTWESPRPKRKPLLGGISWKRLMSKGFK